MIRARDARENLIGRRYKSFPDLTTAESGEPFYYRMASAEMRKMGMVLRNLEAKDATVSIATHSMIDFASEEYILTNDNRLWVVRDVSETLEDKTGAFGTLISPMRAEREIIITLSMVSNAAGVEA